MLFLQTCVCIILLRSVFLMKTYLLQIRAFVHCVWKFYG